MELKGKNILVTGGTGFLGSYIVQRCLDEKARVRVFSTGAQLDNIRHLLKNPRLHFIASDMSDAASLGKAVRGVDLVFHFASFTKTQESYQYPMKDFQTNVVGSMLLLEAMRAHGVKQIVFASTGKVYGQPRYSPVDENHPISPQEPYSVGKYSIERYILLYHKLYQMNYLILRIFGIYGPRQLPKPGSLVGVISILVENILKYGKVDIYGNGSLKRDFLYIDDFVEFCCALIKRNRWQHILNVASGKTVDLNGVLKIISKEIYPDTFKVNYKPSLKSDIDLCPDVSLLKKISCYKPKVTLRSGISRYIAWYKDIKRHGSAAV
ncbi:MAG: NAD-dependent epimerase/dehydratase family protein [Candidatus Omnitrophota bacterium]|nr:MAG: NAD-dependent epimerase/dehydratase family protein [Candidatus Omnitrophota bacterium]